MKDELFAYSSMNSQRSHDLMVSLTLFPDSYIDSSRHPDLLL